MMPSKLGILSEFLIMIFSIYDGLMGRLFFLFPLKSIINTCDTVLYTLILETVLALAEFLENLVQMEFTSQGRLLVVSDR
jgi:hypothetical protein